MFAVISRYYNDGRTEAEVKDISEGTTVYRREYRGFTEYMDIYDTTAGALYHRERVMKESRAADDKGEYVIYYYLPTQSKLFSCPQHVVKKGKEVLEAIKKINKCGYELVEVRKITEQGSR